MLEAAVAGGLIGMIGGERRNSAAMSQSSKQMRFQERMSRYSRKLQLKKKTDLIAPLVLVLTNIYKKRNRHSLASLSRWEITD